MSEKHNPLSGFLDVVQKTAKDAVHAAGTLSGNVTKGVVNTADSVGSAVTGAINTIGNQTVSWVDQNGDGKLDQEDVMLILSSVYARAIDGIPGVSKPIAAFSEDYLKNAPDGMVAARKMLDNAIVKCTTSGFLSGLGGAITIPVALPASITSVLYVQLRMIASVAYMAGLDVRSDAVQTLTFACLAGVSVAEVVKKAGVTLGTKLTTSLVNKIPGKVLTKINQKVGFRLLTKFGEKGVVNIGKMIPVVGGLISGGFDLAETRSSADRAYKEFMQGEFAIERSSADDADVTDTLME